MGTKVQLYRISATIGLYIQFFLTYSTSNQSGYGKNTFAIYRPKPGKEAQLIKLVQEHLPILKSQNLVSDRKPMVMQSKDKCIIEVFEWKSRESIDQAHTNPEVQKLWERFGELCDFESPKNIAEFSEMFSEFEAIN